ncbi:MAG TPA: copper chaperone PCu(A)C [Aestuariivirga sp.]
MNIITKTIAATSLASAMLMSTANAQDVKLGSITIHHPWIKQPVPGAVAAAYATIENTGKDDDTLLKVAVEGVAIAQIHDMKMQGDVMKMDELKDGLAIPAGKTVELKPKSFHIMLINATTTFKPGQEVKGTFTFAKAGAVDISFEVESGRPEMGGMKMNGMKMN